jgi:hypothetical protein
VQWIHRAEVSSHTLGPGMQFRHCMAYHPGRGTTILFSGDEHANLWEYNGTNWVLVEVTGSRPRARMDAGLAYRASTGIRGITLVGGYSRTPNADGSHRLEDVWTFEFEGENQDPPVHGVARGTWTLRGLLDDAAYRPPTLPPRPHYIQETAARSDLRLVDTEKGLLALGGMTHHRIQPNSSLSWDEFDGPANFIYLLDGVNLPEHFLNFFLQGVTGNVGGITELAAAYDSRRKRVLHCGGVRLLSYENAPYVYTEGSLRVLGLPDENLEPTFFHGIELAALPARYGHRMVYDSRRDRLVVFGGSVLTERGISPGEWRGQLQDASRYFEVQLSDNTLTEPAARTAPSARWGHDMVFDERRGVVVLYGGFDSMIANTTLTGLAAQTWELTPVATQFVQQPAPLLDLCTSWDPVGEQQITPWFELTVRVSSPGPVSYQWYQHGKAIVSATANQATLIMPPSPAQLYVNSGFGDSVAGTYVCQVTDACGNTAWSQPSEVRVFSSPVTVSLFLDGVDNDGTNLFLHLCPGESVEIDAPTVVPSDNYSWCGRVVDPVTGNETYECFTNGPAHPLSLQWFRFGANSDGTVESIARQTLVPGATNSTLSLPNITPAVNGYYRLFSFAGCGTGYSDPIEITAGVWIKASPHDQTNRVCEPLALRVSASGKGALRYQWRKNGFPLVEDLHVLGSTNATLNFTRLRYLDDAAYDCVVSDECNTVTSRVAQVSIIPNPPFLLVDTNGPPARTRHGMVYDSARGVSLLFGGLGHGVSLATAYKNDTWSYDGKQWSQLLPSDAPSNRADFGLAYDRHRARVVLFGGMTNDTFTTGLAGDTWEYDGTNWTQRFPAHAPAPRHNCALFYDPVRRVTTLYGGDTTLANPRAGDIWTWDGTDWTQHVVTGDRPLFGGGTYGSPAHPQMVWDERRGYAVLPPTENPIPGGDYITWTWNGTNWTARPYAFAGFGNTPIWAGGGLGLVYDTYRGEVIYWAGDGYDQGYVWRWNGSTWRHDENDLFVGFHLYSATAYDERRNSVVMFGGHFAGSPEVPQGYSSRTFERVLADEPVLLRQPVVLQDNLSAALLIRVVAAGAGPLTYQWLRNGLPLSEGSPFTGVTNSTLSIDGSAAADPGRFRCMVYGRCGSATSDEVTLAPPSSLRVTADAPPVDGSRSILLEWREADGVLQSAPTVNGPWSDIPAARSPLTVPTQESQLFFRLWRP